MHDTTHFITGSQLRGCNTWYDVYQKLSQPPHSIPPERLQTLKKHCTNIYCTGCMNGKVVEVVDTAKNQVFKLSDYSDNPSMKTINGWKVQGYQRFCLNCKENYDYLDSMYENIKCLKQKEIPKKWTDAQPFSNKDCSTLRRYIPAKTIAPFEPEIKNGLFEDYCLGGQYNFDCHKIDDDSYQVVSTVRNTLSWLFFGTVREQRQPDIWDFHVNKPGYFLNFKNTYLQHLPSFSEDGIDFRAIITQHFGMWALVDKSWTSQLADKIRQHGIHSCLEVGAGNGHLCKALNEHGISVMATDKYSTEKNTVTTVTKLDATEAIQSHPEADALIIAWPHKNAGKMIAEWPVGKWVIYIGEKSDDMPGCNAHDDFFNQVDFESGSEIPIPRWENSSDVCLIGKKVKDWERPEWYETESDVEED